MADTIDLATTVAPTPSAIPTRKRFALLRDLVDDKVALLGAVLLLVLILVAVFAPWVAPHDPEAQSLAGRLKPPAFINGGSSEFLLGTDNLGRDVLSRLIYGSRISIIVGLLVVVTAGAVGVLLGLIAGYFGGWLDTFFGWLSDTQLAFPGLLLALVMFTAIGPGLLTVVIVVSATGWVIYGRLARSIVLSAKELPYVDAAIVSGCKTRRVLGRHILPNLLAPILTFSVLDFARVVLAESALSFLGIGLQPPSISWGIDIATGKTYIFNAWWLVTFPGIALSLTVVAINLVAGWLRVAIDPQQRDKKFVAAAVGSVVP